MNHEIHWSDPRALWLPDAEADGQSNQRFYPVVAMPMEQVKGYLFECPDCPSSQGLEMYLSWEAALETGNRLEYARFSGVAAMFNDLKTHRIYSPPVVKVAGDGHFYIVRHNRTFCCLKVFRKLGILGDVKACEGFPVGTFPARIAHDRDAWGDHTRAIKVHPFQPVHGGA